MAAAVTFVACLPTVTLPDADPRPASSSPFAGEDAGPPGAQGVLVDGSTSKGGSAGAAGAVSGDPYTLGGALPSHGPFKGGTRVIIDGEGFSSKVRVWFGATEVPQVDVVPISTRKVQVVAPPGPPGAVDIVVQKGADAATRRVQKNAYRYDSFYVEPETGGTAGGTVITLRGAGTGWKPGAAVSLGDKPCTDARVLASDRITCVTPAQPAGAVRVSVAQEGEEPVTVLDAFTYGDSDNGFRGGLSGEPLGVSGRLKVMAFSSLDGGPIEGAFVLLADSTTPAGKIGATGTLELPAPTGSAVTVTVAAKCYQPTTFVDVPVDTVTVYLDRERSPACLPPSEETPPTGGRPSTTASVEGTVFFAEDIENKKDDPWETFVPKPKIDGDRRVIYLFTAVGDPRTPFKLPEPDKAITDDAPAADGYAFAMPTPPGNVAIYALAGVENRNVSPARFTAYGFGLVRGLAAKGNKVTPDVGLRIDLPLDQPVTIVLDPPKPAATGPDRVQTSVAVGLGNQGFAIVPTGQTTTPLPFNGNLEVRGLPPLAGALEGFTYVATAQAGTGPALTMPLSVVGRFAVRDASTPIPVDSFVRVPAVGAPSGLWDGSTLSVSFADGGYPPELLVAELRSGGGLVAWTVAAPASKSTGEKGPYAREIKLPDLRKLPAGGLVPGPINVTMSGARVSLGDDDGTVFDYGQLRYRHLTPRGWSAYAQAAAQAQLSP